MEALLESIRKSREAFHPVLRSWKSWWPLSILAIVLVAVFRLQSQSIAMHSAARFHSLAPLLAQSKMAEIVSSKIEDLSISDSGDFGENFAGYTWQFTINDIESEILEDYAEKFKRIDLVITLNDGEYQYGFRSYKLFEE